MILDIEDYTKHQDLKRLNNYLSRATKIKGNWKKDKYSPNNLAINLLWNNSKTISRVVDDVLLVGVVV